MHTAYLSFFFSVRCHGGSVLSPGSSNADTKCDMTQPVSTTTEVSLQISSVHPHPRGINFSPSLNENFPQINTTTTPSLLPSSSMTPSTPENQTTIGPKPDTSIMIYCTGKYEAISFEFSLQTLKKYYVVTLYQNTMQKIGCLVQRSFKQFCSH